MTPRALALALVAAALAACSREDATDGAAPSATCCDAGPALADSPEAEAQRAGVPLEMTNEWGMRFRLVPGGDVLVGSPADEAGRSPEETRHEVRLLWSYYLSAQTVTAEQWARGMGAVPPAAGAAPATGITFDEATEFARRLSERDPKWSYRLPTEAEWERAARAGSEAATLPAGTNAWGLEGLTDGVGEWCRDPYFPFPDWRVVDPLHVSEPGDRVVRGLAKGSAARAAERTRVPPGTRLDDVGVRLVAKLSYGKSDVGSATLVFHTVETDAAEEVVAERTGYRIRMIAVADRLESRQHGVRPLPWVRLPMKGTPMTVHVPPGRYYAQCEVPDDGPPRRGIELKVEAIAGVTTRVDLPLPKPGGTLNDPE